MTQLSQVTDMLPTHRNVMSDEVVTRDMLLCNTHTAHAGACIMHGQDFSHGPASFHSLQRNHGRLSFFSSTPAKGPNRRSLPSILYLKPPCCPPPPPRTSVSLFPTR